MPADIAGHEEREMTPMLMCPLFQGEDQIY